MTVPEDPFDQPGIFTAVSTVITATELLDEASTTSGLEEVDWEDMALLIKQLREARKAMGQIEAAMERYIDREWKRHHLSGTIEVPEVGAVEVHRSKDRRSWDHTALAAAVVEANMPTDGVAPDPWDVRDWLMAAAGIGYWRVTVLRGLGINPDGYCESTPGAPSVSIQ